MQKEHAAKTAGGLSSLWDRGEADRVRTGDGAHKLYGKRLSMHLLMQPIIAERVLSDTLLQGQGFLARCLIAWYAGIKPWASKAPEQILLIAGVLSLVADSHVVAIQAATIEAATLVDWRLKAGFFVCSDWIRSSWIRSSWIRSGRNPVATPSAAVARNRSCTS